MASLLQIDSSFLQGFYEERIPQDPFGIIVRLACLSRMIPGTQLGYYSGFKKPWKISLFSSNNEDLNKIQQLVSRALFWYSLKDPTITRICKMAQKGLEGLKKTYTSETQINKTIGFIESAIKDAIEGKPPKIPCYKEKYLLWQEKISKVAELLKINEADSVYSYPEEVAIEGFLLEQHSRLLEIERNGEKNLKEFSFDSLELWIASTDPKRLGEDEQKEDDNSILFVRQLF